MSPTGWTGTIKVKGELPGLAAVLLSFGLALAAAGGMVLAGCDSPAGVDNGYDGAVSAEESGTPAFSAAGTKTIEVRFEMPGSGTWMDWSEGIVGTQDNSHLIYGRGDHDNDYTITITVPTGDEYLNVYWRVECTDISGYYLEEYVQAKMKAQSGTINLDFSGADRYDPTPAAKNLYDVECFRDDGSHQYEKWWKDLESRALSYDSSSPTTTIKVKFEVLDYYNDNGMARGFEDSTGIVGTQYNSRLIYRRGSAMAGYKIAIIAPEEDEYLNIYWKGIKPGGHTTYVFAKMKPESGTITLDFDAYGALATKNLYDVEVNRAGGNVNLHWEDLIAHAAGTEPFAIRTIKFDVRNGGYGLLNSYGMVSDENDSLPLYDGASFADDYTFTIMVWPEEEYLNIRWKGTDIWHRDTYVKAKMKPESGTITLDYNGHKNVATKNLYDVGSSDAGEWEDAKKRAAGVSNR